MVDIVDPGDEYSVAEFQARGRREAADATGPVLVVGGSGLHFRALVDPLEFPPTDRAVRRELESLGADEARAALLEVDPDASQHIDMENPRRVIRALEVARITGAGPSERAATPEAVAVRQYEAELPVAVVGVDPGDDLRSRIERRFDAMLEWGLVDEVASLVGEWGVTARQAVGYREVADMLAGTSTLEQARADAISATWGLAKRQRTFFGRDPRIRWVEWRDDPDEMALDVVRCLEEGGWSS